MTLLVLRLDAVLLVFLLLSTLMLRHTSGFRRIVGGAHQRRLATNLAAGPRPLHKVFTVEKALPEIKADLDVRTWPTWETEGSSKYKTGVKSPLKTYDCNELSYIISGKMEITPVETGVPVLVQEGDFITFPKGFACYWFVIEPVVKHWYIY